MAKRSSFFMKQWGYEQSFFKYVENAFSMVPTLYDDNGKVNKRRLVVWIKVVDFIKPFIDWKSSDGFEKLEDWLDEQKNKFPNANFIIEIYKKKLSLYFRIAKEKPDLLIKDESKTFKFQDTETGEITEEFPEGFINAED